MKDAKIEERHRREVLEHIGLPSRNDYNWKAWCRDGKAIGHVNSMPAIVAQAIANAERDGRIAGLRGASSMIAMCSSLTEARMGIEVRIRELEEP